MSKDKEVVIVGCGVIGLTTALTLQELGYKVKIITAQLPAETTSAIAAAIWLPYEVKPYDKVEQWSKESYIKYQSLSAEKTSGVKMIDMTIIIGTEEDAWWKDALPQENIRAASANELPANYDMGYILKVPMIETQLHLQYLIDKFENQGGEVVVKKVKDLNAIDTEAMIINCTGLAAAELTNDKELYPIQGQIVLLESDPNLKCTVSEIVEGINKDKIAYIVPRSDYTVLGGTAAKHVNSLQADDDEVEKLIERCVRIDQDVKKLKYITTKVGLRPGRSEIRLEREDNVIHNYGHGGGGYTVSWGCAKAVSRLII